MPDADADALSNVANHELQLSASDGSLLEYIDRGTVPADDAPGAAPDAAAPAASASEAEAEAPKAGARAVALARRKESMESDGDRSEVSFAEMDTSMRSGLKTPGHARATPTAHTFQYTPPPAAGGDVEPHAAPSPLHASEPVATAVAEAEHFGLKMDPTDDLDSSEATTVISNAAPSGAKRASRRGSLKGVLKNPLKKARRGPGLKRAGSVKVQDEWDAVFDLDGDGQLDAIEQAMRDRDVNKDGTLDNREVHKIIEDQMKSEEDYGMYKRWAAGLLCLVALLSLSNFGTSWASALLSKDTSADGETGAVQSKGTGEVVGYQGTGHVVEIEELTDDEFEQRRLLVDAEMAEDPDHPDHTHRRLGRKKNKNNVCGCTKIAYDHGKVKERDLVELVAKCDRGKTVQMKRKWKNGDIMDMAASVDYDTICTPGTEVVKKGKKKGGNNKNKNNKNKNDKNKKNNNKVKVFEEEVIEFRQKDKNGKKKSTSFNCRGGNCFTSGQSLHQGAGHPCRIERDFKGASQCEEYLACYDPDDHSARRGSGICAELQEFARQDQVCDMDLGVNACERNYLCYATLDRGIEVSAGTVRRGTCRRATTFAGPGDVCDVGRGDGACVNGYRCLGANGREILRGVGVCLAPRGGAPWVDVVRFASVGQECSTSYGLDACAAGNACYARGGNPFEVGKGRTICQAVRSGAGLGGVCNVAFVNDACAAGLQCLDNNGRAIQGGFGVCANGGGRTNGGGGGMSGGGCTNTGPCLPAGASMAVDCTNSCSCLSGTCMKYCNPGSDRWFCL